MFLLILWKLKQRGRQLICLLNIHNRDSDTFPFGISFLDMKSKHLSVVFSAYVFSIASYNTIKIARRNGVIKYVVSNLIRTLLLF